MFNKVFRRLAIWRVLTKTLPIWNRNTLKLCKKKGIMRMDKLRTKWMQTISSMNWISMITRILCKDDEQHLVRKQSNFTRKSVLLP